MNKIIAYFQNAGRLRIAMTLVGNLFVGLGVGVFKLSRLGSPPFDGMNMAIAEVLGIPYPLLQIIVNLFLFAFQLWLGRHLLGLGTVLNAFLLGYIVTFFYEFFLQFGAPQSFLLRLVIMAGGVLSVAFGLSLYQTADLGVAPYDALSMIIGERQHRLPYFWCRLATDAVCALLCFLFGGIVGLGTLFSAFGFGPFIHFFDLHFSRKLVRKSEAPVSKGARSQ
ncbi:YczE/YyaS/YitT family protein [Lachnoclostridium sp. Marseille-P6806]|uniref:YczE/YyaS/YitT family protein n=1 Tax=Lachnoclostridium sp. Marseille-P6806 TaxID=2364793 RepID=UPI001030EC9F|nr:YitT family protein [Lachnoclostridium sp. Marseille-P6806]